MIKKYLITDCYRSSFGFIVFEDGKCIHSSAFSNNREEIENKMDEWKPTVTHAPEGITNTNTIQGGI